MGQLLFIINLNYFEHCLEHARDNMYADNTEITISSNDQAELIDTAQAELLIIVGWMRINNLSLNPTKTEHIKNRSSTKKEKRRIFSAIIHKPRKN